MSKKCGFVTLVGPTNVGKSSIINALVGDKVSIVSAKPQTTRKRLKAILTEDNFQMIFIDSPGLHKPLHQLGEYIYQEATKLDNVDVVVFVRGADKDEFEYGEEEILEKIEKLNYNGKIFVLNKVDLLKEEEYMQKIEEIKEKYPFFDDYIPVSATTGFNLDKLKETILKFLPEGEFLYPTDITAADITVREIAAELIRETILDHFKQEIPHSVAVEILDFVEKPNITVIEANIYVERPTQKAIVIGKGGKMIKKVGTISREKLERFLNTKVFLKLWVKVKEDWRNKKGALAEFGYRL